MKKGVSGNRAADLNGIPRSTLKDRLSGRVVHGTNPGPTDLARHLLTAAEIGYEKTQRDVCCLVESYLKTKTKKILMGTKLSNGWWEKFLKRNPNLVLHVGDSTAGVRFDAITTENMDHYFNLLKCVYDEYEFSKHPESIYNMDETGVPLCPRPPKIIVKKGQTPTPPFSGWTQLLF